MRTPALVLCLALLVSVTGMTAGVAQASEHGGPPDGVPGPGNNPQNNENGDDGNNTNGNTTGGPPGHTGQPGPPPHANASDVARERAEANSEARPAQAQGAWNNAMAQAQADRAWEQRDEELSRAPAHARDNMGLFVPTDHAFEGRYVSFKASEDWLAIEDVTVGDTLVFESIVFPGDDQVRIRHAGNAIHIQGEDWRFSIVDAPPAPMTLRAGDQPFYAVIDEGAAWQETHFGAIVQYDTDPAIQARLVGPDPRDGDVPGLLVIQDALNFHVSAERNVLPGVSNQARQAIDEALTARTVGGEITLLRDPQDRTNVLSDVVVFEELEITVSPGQALGEVPENATAHTIAVSAHGIPGKTVVINLESDLVDPRDLHIRYYNQVSEDTVEEVQIRPAESLAHALQPATAGLVPKYWVVEDIDGVQLLVTIPHFSTHYIELLSFEPDLVTVSLIAGALGAVVIVALAAVGIFRRPKDEL